MLSIKMSGFKEFEKRIYESPEIVKELAQMYFVRAVAKVFTVINNNPWKIGGGGGGAPVATRNLVARAHDTIYEPFQALIAININKVKYAGYVHEGTRKMEKRPWLDYAQEKSDLPIQKLQEDFINDLTKHLAY
jgi:hypothetical protein